jgi:hypothetical protein
MWEGNTGGEESVSTRARFVPGSGRLLLLAGGRFVFLADGYGSFDLSDGLSHLATNRDFFLGCIERWFAAGSKPDLVAGVVAVGSTAVLAIGRQAIHVQTASAVGLVDPTLASFAAEQVFAGELVSISVGDVSLLASNSSVTGMCWASQGLLPADSFVLSPSTTPAATAVVQIRTEASTEVAAQSVVRIEAAISPPAASVPDRNVSGNEPVPSSQVVTTTVVEVANTASVPTRDALPLVSAPSGLEGRYDDFDEALDGATVWPTAGRRNSPAPLVTQVIVASATVESETQAVGVAQNEELQDALISIVNGDLSATSTALADAENAQADLGADSWEPPAPEPFLPERSSVVVGSPSSNGSTDGSTGSFETHSNSTAPVSRATSPQGRSSVPANGSETVTWTPVSNGVQIAEPDSTELTIMAGDLARIRKTFVAVAATGVEPPVGTVMGVYCRGGHFTDSRNPRCLFCQEETDFDTMTSATPPLLGVLAFDDNRVTPVTGLVLVGRKPSTNDPSVTAVAFGEDMMLSRVHFEVRLLDWDVSVVDKQSANGTQIEHPDGRRIVARPNIEVRLDPGSIVRFGNHQATFRRS